MSLTLYFHPLASFCHKVLLALYENGTPFEGRVVDLADAASSAEMLSLWPVGKIPVLRDEARGKTVPETSIIVEYLDTHYRGPVPLVPADAERALEVRLWDRFFDLYVQTPMQKIVTDSFRSEAAKDRIGVEEAKRTLARAYDLLDERMESRRLVVGDALTLADCAAAPALFYAETVYPFSNSHRHVTDYFARLESRPSFSRVIAEARPYFDLFPFRDAIPPRFVTPSSSSPDGVTR